MPYTLAPGQALLSLQEQGTKLAKEVGHPLGQGRIKGGGVFRVRSIADFETVAYEAGHYIETNAGQSLKDLVDSGMAELSAIDTNPREAFAEFAWAYLTDPEDAAPIAPKFTADFEKFLAANHPDILSALQAARAAHLAYRAAPATEIFAASVCSAEEAARRYNERYPLTWRE